MKRAMKPSESVASRARRRPPLIEVNRVDDGLGELAEPVPEPHLVEGIQAARLQPIAAEGALEVGVPLQQHDLHPSASKQVGESRSGGPRPDDDDASDRHDATPFGLGTITVPAMLPNDSFQPHASAAKRVGGKPELGGPCL